MNIRKASLQDIDQLRQLFFDTINIINSKDYNEDQIQAWSSGAKNINGWKTKLEKQYFVVAEIEGKITGFASLKDDSYLDFMYIHKDHQRKGIATQLFLELKKIAEKSGAKEMTADVSITARPFFEKQGFTVLKKQSVYIDETILTNFKMKLLLR